MGALNTAYLTELHLPLPTPEAQRKAEFEPFPWHACVGCIRRSASCGDGRAQRERTDPSGQVGGVYNTARGAEAGAGARGHELLIEKGMPGPPRIRETDRLHPEYNQGAAAPPTPSLGFGRPELSVGCSIAAFRCSGCSNAAREMAGQSGEVYTYEVHEVAHILSPGPGNFISRPARATARGRPSDRECPDLSTLAAHDRHAVAPADTLRPTFTVRLNFNPAASAAT